MQATILPHISINESLKSVITYPINFVTICPAVIMAFFGILPNIVINSCARLYCDFHLTENSDIIVLCKVYSSSCQTLMSESLKFIIHLYRYFHSV